MSTPTDRWTRVGFLLVLVGLMVQIAASLFWSPGTFVVSAAVGLPLVLIGAVTIWVRARRLALVASTGSTSKAPHAQP